jgi:hypothetical protein
VVRRHHRGVGPFSHGWLESSVPTSISLREEVNNPEKDDSSIVEPIDAAAQNAPSGNLGVAIIRENNNDEL